MLKFSVLASCFFLMNGCSAFIRPVAYVEGPTEPPVKNDYPIKFEFTDNPNRDCKNTGKFTALKGCATYSRDFCTITVSKNDWGSIIHELQHCFHGAWHADYYE